MFGVGTEFFNCEFGDSRLTRRVMAVSESLSKNPELSINASCGSFTESKAAYRLFQNPKICQENLISGHISKTLERINQQKSMVLVIQDTTDLIYTQFPSIKGLGHRSQCEGYASAVKGIMLHTSLAVTADGLPLGILKQTYFTYDDARKNRGQEDTNRKGVNRLFPIEKKSSFRWIQHFEEIEKEIGDQKVVHVADRESDIYEFLHAATVANSNYVIRSSINRKTHESQRYRDTSTINEKLKLAPSLGSIEITMQKEKIVCSVKQVETILRPPNRSLKSRSETLLPIRVYVVEISQLGETNHPIHWRLLTNMPCGSLDSAVNIAAIYKTRWSIECFHRILKSGFGVEKSRLNSRDRLENLATILSIISWHLFWIYNLARKNPEHFAESEFDSISIKVLALSGKALKVPIPSKMTLQQAILVIARLGGFLGRKSDGPPGMINIWRGWGKLHERIELLEQLNCG